MGYSAYYDQAWTVSPESSLSGLVRLPVELNLVTINRCITLYLLRSLSTRWVYWRSALVKGFMIYWLLTLCLVHAFTSYITTPVGFGGGAIAPRNMTLTSTNMDLEAH